MNAHLKEIACHIEDGKHAVIVLDCAGWHISRELQIPSNITLVPLPPYSPELNPQEWVWQVLKDRDLKNRTFEDDNDILDACSKAWNAFISVPNAIKALCSRQWAILST
jgi:transposase